MANRPATLEEALAAIPEDRVPRIELGRNLLDSSQRLMYLSYSDPFNPRRKAVPVLPGPLVGESIPDMLKTLAMAFERAEELRMEGC